MLSQPDMRETGRPVEQHGGRETEAKAPLPQSYPSFRSPLTVGSCLISLSHKSHPLMTDWLILSAKGLGPNLCEYF